MTCIPPNLKRFMSGAAVSLAAAYIVIVVWHLTGVSFHGSIKLIVFNLVMFFSPAVLLIALRKNISAVSISGPLVAVVVGSRIYSVVDHYFYGTVRLFGDAAFWLGMLTQILAVLYLGCWCAERIAVCLNRKWEAMREVRASRQ